jgi:hypothetical protein
MSDPFAPAAKHAAIGVDVSLAPMPAKSALWVLQARVALRPVDPGVEAGHTGWFVVTPAVARRMAADLLEAAQAAEGVG